MKTKLLGLITLAAFLGLPTANATTFAWSYSSLRPGVSGSGTLDAVDEDGGLFLVDAMSGTANGLTITGLTTYANDDQLLYDTNPQLDARGLAFIVSDGEVFNLYSYVTIPHGFYNCGSSTYCLIGPGTNPPGASPDDQVVPISFSAVAETPLPTALPLFATGLGALGLLGWRRKRKTLR